MLLDRIHKTLLLSVIVFACLFVVLHRNQFLHRFVIAVIDDRLLVLQKTGAKVIVRLAIFLGSHHAISRLRHPILDHSHVLLVALVIALQAHLLSSTFRKHT